MRGKIVAGSEPVVNWGLVRPGDRICVAVSGGADSVALLRLIADKRADLGTVPSVLHVEHGIRGEASQGDATFVAELAERLDVPLHIIHVDTPARVAERKESLEEAARNLRYEVFRKHLASGNADAIATAHTLDDQAETVVMKLLRGAWTEGLSGIHKVLAMDGQGRIVRPLLGVRRSEIEAYLRALGQTWREDASNSDLAQTRNRVRHHLMPALREYNPQIERCLGRVACNALAEEEHWQAELDRVLPGLLLPGQPVRGGGRSATTLPGEASMGMDLARLLALDAGLLRRVIRAVAEKCGAPLDCEQTEQIVDLVERKGQPRKSVPRRVNLPNGVSVVRSFRELQFERHAPATGYPMSYMLPVPGVVDAPAFGSRILAALAEGTPGPLPAAAVRVWQPGDRVMLMHSRGPKKVKEVLERMHVHGPARSAWPVVVWQSKIIWMRGVELDPSPDAAVLRIVEELLP